MPLTLKKTDRPSSLKTGALAVFLFEDDAAELAKRADLADLAEFIAPRLENKDFEAKHQSTLVLFPGKKGGPERLILAGLGKRADCSLVKVKQAAAKAVQAAQDLKLKELALMPPLVESSLGEPVKILEATALGAILGGYQFKELKTKAEDLKPAIDSLIFVHVQALPKAKAEAALNYAQTAAEAVVLARDLINRPANLLFPQALAEEALRAAAPGVKVTVLTMEDAANRGMGAFLGVAGGSARPGRVIVLEYHGGKPKELAAALVGKGITFDSGGLSLKPAENMAAMKTDMAGGAAVIAAINAAAKLKMKVNVIGVVPACENMPDGAAYRPGDVLRSMSGLTIEVTNTDAEGRLILADALTLAQEYQPKYIVDLATLTGACIVALGEKCAGLFSNSDELADKLRAASEAAGERVWRMPLFDDYFEGMKSDVADFKNAGTRMGGAITAALFIKQFIKDGAAWAHIDIAGPSRADKASADVPAGGTGYGVQMLLEFLRNL